MSGQMEDGSATGGLPGTGAAFTLGLNEDTFRAIADYATGWESWLGPDGRFLWVSPSVERTTGYSAEEVLAMPDFLRTLIAPEDLDRASRYFREALGGSRRENVEFEILRKDGLRCWLSVSWQPIFDRSGHSLGTRVSARDVSNHKRAEKGLQECLARSRAILDATPVPLAMNDSKMNVTFLNPAFVRLFGYTLDDLPNLSAWWTKAYPCPEYRQHIIKAWEAELDHARTTGKPFSPIEATVRCKDGTDKTILASAAMLSSDPTCEHVVILADITDQKATEAKVARLSRFYAAQSRCSQAIAEAGDKEELFGSLCQIVVEQGDITMAWIGLVDGATQRVRQVSAYGAGIQYVDGIEISLDRGDPSGRGPTGTAIREGRPVWCQDFMRDPATAPWRDRGELFGWRSSASIPFRMAGQPTGALTIYSDKPDAFDPDVQKLLIEMADNVGFALDHFAQEAESEAARVELQKLRMAVEQSANIVIITDRRGVIEYVNPAFERITGYTSAEALGQKTSMLKSGDQDELFYQQLWETITSGQSWEGQFHNRRKDGSLYWGASTISPVIGASGEILHFIALTQDVTAKNAMEANLIEALNRAEAANRAKDEFLAVMSHELRTPLNGVLGFADLLATTRLDSEQEDYTQMIRSSGGHLLEVVNDILDFASLEKGRTKIASATFSVSDLVESSCLAARESAGRKGVGFRHVMDTRIPGEIVGDERRIRQILINLLGNAVKFTSRGAVVFRVGVELIGERREMIFTVQDTGPGMSPETLGSLFKPFTQADSSLSRRFEGTGLGLAISKRLADAMSGTITASSTPGEGSTFTFRLPIETPVAEPAERSNGSAPGDNIILVVEDDRICGLLAGKMLRNLGHRVELAHNGQEAVTSYQKTKYSAILMDMQMPVMDGIEATRRIREIEMGGGIHVPIIALTANVMPGDRERCLAAGMNDFLSKPFKKDDLAAVILRWTRGEAIGMKQSWNPSRSAAD